MTETINYALECHRNNERVISVLYFDRASSLPMYVVHILDREQYYVRV